MGKVKSEDSGRERTNNTANITNTALKRTSMSELLSFTSLVTCYRVWVWSLLDTSFDSR